MVLANGALICNMPMGDVLEEHIRSGADITCVCTPKRVTDKATTYMVDDNGTITDVISRSSINGGYDALEVYVVSKKLLLELIAECDGHNEYSFHHAVLQGMKEKLKLHAYVFNGYADHTSFNGVSAALSQLRGYLQASRTCFHEKEYADLYNDYSDSVNAYLDKRLNTFTRKVASKMPSVHGYTEQELLDALNEFFDTDRKFGRRFIQRNEQGGRFINVPLLAMELNDAQTAKIDKYVRYDRRDNDAVSEYCYRVTDIIMREYTPSD